MITMAEIKDSGERTEFLSGAVRDMHGGKALELCTENDISACSECEYCGCIGNCVDHLITDALDLINRQKAEIERLQNILNEKAILFAENTKNEIKAEAIKEFAENAKEELYEWVGADNSIPLYRIKQVIDNLVKEIVGDTE